MAIIGTLAAEAATRRLSVRITDADLTLLDQEAKTHGMVLGYYLDLVVSNEANRVRQLHGLPPIHSPYLAPEDDWRRQRPR